MNAYQEEALIFEDSIFKLININIVPSWDHFLRTLMSYDEIELYDQPIGKLVLNATKNPDGVIFNSKLPGLGKDLEMDIEFFKYYQNEIKVHLPNKLKIKIEADKKKIDIYHMDISQSYSVEEARYVGNYINFLKFLRSLLEEIIENVMMDIHKELEEKFSIFANYKSNKDE